MQLPLMFLDRSFVHYAQDASSSNVPQKNNNNKKKHENRSPGRCAYSKYENSHYNRVLNATVLYLSKLIDTHSIAEKHPTSS